MKTAWPGKPVRRKNISNWLLGDVSRILNEKNLVLADTSLTPEKLTDMISLIEKGTISVTAGTDRVGRNHFFR